MIPAIKRNGKKINVICGIGGDTTFNANEIIGKTLIAKTSVNVRSGGSTDYPILYVAHPGDSLGVVFSWQMKLNDLWWMLETSTPGKYNFVQHAVGRFDPQSLKDQGAVTTKDKTEAAAEKDKTWQDKLFDLAKSAGSKILLVGAAVGIITAVIKSRK